MPLIHLARHLRLCAICPTATNVLLSHQPRTVPIHHDMVPLPSHVHPLQGNGQHVTTDVQLHSLLHRDDSMVHRGNAMVPTSATSHLDHNLRTLIVIAHRHPAVNTELTTRTTASLVHNTTDHSHLMPDLVLIRLDKDLTMLIDVNLGPTTIISPVTRHQ